MYAGYVKNICARYLLCWKMPQSRWETFEVGLKIATFLTGIIPLMAGIAYGVSTFTLWYLGKEIDVIDPKNHPQAASIQKIASEQSLIPPSLEELQEKKQTVSAKMDIESLSVSLLKKQVETVLVSVVTMHIEEVSTSIQLSPELEFIARQLLQNPDLPFTGNPRLARLLPAFESVKLLTSVQKIGFFKFIAEWLLEDSLRQHTFLPWLQQSNEVAEFLNYYLATIVKLAEPNKSMALKTLYRTCYRHDSNSFGNAISRGLQDSPKEGQRITEWFRSKQQAEVHLTNMGSTDEALQAFKKLRNDPVGVRTFLEIYFLTQGTLAEGMKQSFQAVMNEMTVSEVALYA
ncbi:MAG TPA: hypothetical protein VIJ14_07150, partial [Rhabdochlamydiaceae bacterium]